MPFNIPGEVTDRIIGFIDDHSCLCHCALVCKDWLPASRHQLFSAVYVRDGLIAHTPRSLKHGDAHESSFFLEHVLRSQSMWPWLASIRRLRSEAERPIIHELATHAPNILWLSLTECDWCEYPVHRAASLVPSKLASLRELFLGNIKCPSFLFFRRFIAALPTLDTLKLSNPSWPPPSDLSLSLFPQQRPVLRNLQVVEHIDHLTSIGPFMSWLSSTPTADSLCWLSCRSDDDLCDENGLSILSSTPRLDMFVRVSARTQPIQGEYHHGHRTLNQRSS